MFTRFADYFRSAMLYALCLFVGSAMVVAADMKIATEPTGQIIWERTFSNAEAKVAIQVIEDMVKNGKVLDTLEVVKRAMRRSTLPDKIAGLRIFEKTPYEGRAWQADNGTRSTKWQKVTTNEYKTSGGFTAIYSQISYETWRDDAKGRGLPDSCHGVLRYYDLEGTKLWEVVFPRDYTGYGSLKLSSDGSYVFMNVNHVDSMFERGRNWVFNRAGVRVLDARKEFAAPVMSPNGRYYLSVERLGKDPRYNDYRVVCFDVEGGKRSEMMFKNQYCMDWIKVHAITNEGLFTINRTDLQMIYLYNSDCKELRVIKLPKATRASADVYQGGKFISIYANDAWRLFETSTMRELLVTSEIRTNIQFPNGVRFTGAMGEKVLPDASVFFWGYNRGKSLEGTRKTLCGIYDSTGIRKWFSCDGYYRVYYSEDKNIVAFCGLQLELSNPNATKEHRDSVIQYNKQLKVVIIEF